MSSKKTKDSAAAAATARATGNRRKDLHLVVRISPAEYRELVRLSSETAKPGNVSAGARLAIARAAAQAR